MKQYDSTMNHFEKGTTLWNCKPSVSEILEGVTKWLEKENVISYETRNKINKDVNGLKGFKSVWKYLDSVSDRVSENNPIHTPQGDIFHIAEGASKVTFCMSICKKEYTARNRTTLQDNRNRTAKFVLKFNKKPLEASALGSVDGEKAMLERDGAMYQQVVSEKEAYEKLSKFDDIAPHIIKVWRHYKRYNCIIEDYAEYIGTLRDCAEKCGDDYDRLRNLFRKYDVNDLHGENVGIFEGRVVVIDYGL